MSGKQGDWWRIEMNGGGFFERECIRHIFVTATKFLDENKLIYSGQHGISKGKSCLTNLIEFFL